MSQRDTQMEGGALQVRNRRSFASSVVSSRVIMLQGLLEDEVAKHRRIRVGDTVQMALFIRVRLAAYLRGLFCSCIGCVNCCVFAVSCCFARKKQTERSKKTCGCFNRSNWEKKVLLQKRGEFRLREDLSLDTLVTTVHHLQAAVEAAVLTDPFKRANIPHTRRNIIDLDSEITEDSEELEVDEHKQDPTNLNIIKSVLFRRQFDDDTAKVYANIADLQSFYQLKAKFSKNKDVRRLAFDSLKAHWEAQRRQSMIYGEEEEEEPVPVEASMAVSEESNWNRD